MFSAYLLTTHLSRVVLHQGSRPLPQVLCHKLAKLDLAQEANALAVLAARGGQTSSSSQRTNLPQQTARHKRIASLSTYNLLKHICMSVTHESLC